MTAAPHPDDLPGERRDDLARARRLEKLTIAWMISVIAVIGMTMQTSQAMRTAWIEDMLSLVPPTVFLIAARFEKKPATRNFPFGFQRVNSLAFMIAAVALAAMGAFLLFEAVSTLLKGERVTLGLVTLFGVELWVGWLMIAALAYSVVPPVILGRMKLPLARSLNDKVLHTDAMMNKADWMTGLAAIAGIIGLGFGLWWADALAAGFISFDILRDGIRAIRVATAELIDGAPRALEEDRIADDALALEQALGERFPGAHVRMRETGRYIRAEIQSADTALPPLDEVWPGPEGTRWRLAELSLAPPAEPKSG